MSKVSGLDFWIRDDYFSEAKELQKDFYRVRRP